MFLLYFGLWVVTFVIEHQHIDVPALLWLMGVMIFAGYEIRGVIADLVSEVFYISCTFCLTILHPGRWLVEGLSRLRCTRQAESC